LPAGVELAHGADATDVLGDPREAHILRQRQSESFTADRFEKAEADFVASKRGTLLVIPDTYGRFRPRVTIDGKDL
jgi:hypothetical protein